MKRIFFFLSLIVLHAGLAAQNTKNDEMPTTIEGLSQKAEKFGKSIPQEKVFLHLDNTCYFIGDTIWYKGYVTRADKGTLTNLSRILYVELLTPDGYLVERQQLEMAGGTAHGAFCLKDSLYAGYYELRAYTLWMLNFGRYEHPHSIWTEEKFYNKRMAKDFFRDYDKLYSRVFPVFDKPDDKGFYPKDMTLRPMRRYYKSRKGKPELDVRFYPEGGEMVAGTTGRIAFEANTQEGEHLNVEMSIRDRDGEEVSRAKTANRGRGMFIIPNIDTKDGYQAVFKYQGYDYTVELPRPAKEGCAMSVTQEEGVLHLDFHVSLNPGQRSEALGLQIMHNGVTQDYRPVDFSTRDRLTMDISTGQLPTGIHQLTLFDSRGRIYADRLVFINHHDYDRPRISVTGIEESYSPFAPISIRLKIDEGSASSPHVSLSVRDRITDENTYDNGNILTEMLLCSELKGFVETPGYYFESDTPERRQALDLLMMVQGWRRYSWRTMAGMEPFALEYMPEQNQTIAGCVNRAEDFRMDRSEFASEECWDPGSGTMDYTKDPHLKEEKNPLDELKQEQENEEGNYGIPQEQPGNPAQQAAQDTYSFFYGSILSNLKKEVNVWPTYVQGDDMLEVMQATENGTFFMQTPKFYGECILFLSAADLDKDRDYLIKSRKKDFTNEEAFPDYFVKLNRFYPVFPKPYNYYQNAEMEGWADLPETDAAPSGDAGRTLATVTVRSKKGGLRKLDLKKPALVADAYETFNLTADYGMNAGTHNWITFPQQAALAYIGDMGMERDFFLQVRYDGKAINRKAAHRSTAPAAMLNGEKIEFPSTIWQSKGELDKYHFLRNIDKLYIYTDYAPREEGSRKYSQDNQPDVVIDLRLFKNDMIQPTYRDRRYILQGYAVCDDFYSPDYSRTPLPDTKDYRRTLYWTPEVTFNEQGEATVELYNNSNTTTLSIDIEGWSGEGVPIVWSKKR